MDGALVPDTHDTTASLSLSAVDALEAVHG